MIPIKLQNETKWLDESQIDHFITIDDKDLITLITGKVVTGIILIDKQEARVLILRSRQKPKRKRYGVKFDWIFNK